MGIKGTDDIMVYFGEESGEMNQINGKDYIQKVCE